MIRHAVQLVEWLSGNGVTKSTVIPDKVEFDDQVKLTLDLAEAPGSPFGTPTFASQWVSAPAAGAGNNNHVYFEPSSPGGAVIKAIAVSAACAAVSPQGFEFNNRLPGTMSLTFGTVENTGTRQFDQWGQGKANTRGIQPFGSVTTHNRVAAGVIPLAGQNRRGDLMPIPDLIQPSNIYLPPGLTGFSLGQLDSNVILEIGFWYELMPLTGTGLPIG